MRLNKTAALLALVGAAVGWGSFWIVAEAPGVLPLYEKPVSVLFVGDIMLDRAVSETARSKGSQSLFASSSELFSRVDFSLANLEGPITDNPSIVGINHDMLRFTFDPVLTREILAPLNLSAVSLANNHSLDFGRSGYNATRQYLATWDIAAFGDPFNTTGLISATLRQGSKTICLVGYSELFNPDTTSAVDEIARLRGSCWRIVVFAHWGLEYSHGVTLAQQAEAHAFVDAGADLVVGAHPHVVEPMEVYNGHAIFYSLGNFMFDQNFSWDTQHAFALRADFYPGKTRLTLTPVTIAQEHSSLTQEPDRTKTLELMGGGFAQSEVDTIVLP